MSLAEHNLNHLIEQLNRAFISMKITDEAAPLIAKYVRHLEPRFSPQIGFSSALIYGLRQLQKSEGIPDITFY